MTQRWRYFSIYKPYGMLSQFTDEGGNPGLAHLDFRFPSDCYPLGRLDRDSEGLLLLTNDASVNQRLLDPRNAHPRTYWVQVEGSMGVSDCEKLSNGVIISIDGKEFRTRPALVELIDTPANLPDRTPPVRFRKSIPTSWISLTLTEGKNRQVRKMTAAVGYPTLRLIRVAVGKLALPEWKPGSVTEWSSSDFFEKTGIKKA